MEALKCHSRKYKEFSWRSMNSSILMKAQRALVCIQRLSLSIIEHRSSEDLESYVLYFVQMSAALLHTISVHKDRKVKPWGTFC